MPISYSSALTCPLHKGTPILRRHCGRVTGRSRRGPVAALQVERLHRRSQTARSKAADPAKSRKVPKCPRVVVARGETRPGTLAQRRAERRSQTARSKAYP
jgi:hypothetical protein